MKGHGDLSKKGAKIVAALERFHDALESGEPIEEKYTVRRMKLDPGGRDLGPEEIKTVRATLGVSQPIFGQLLGVGETTVRSWEQGRRTPSPMARRFLQEIQATPEHWRGRLRALATLQPSASERRKAPVG